MIHGRDSAPWTVDRAGELLRGMGASPLDIVREVQGAMTPVKYSNWKSEGRMKEALGMVMRAGEELSALRAADPHNLARCNEAERTVLCAERCMRGIPATEGNGG